MADTYKELDVYKLSVEISDLAWGIYKELTNDIKYSAGQQLIRSIDSVSANIAEGFGRYYYMDSVRFYYNARGSLYESEHWFSLLRKRDLIKEDLFKNVTTKINRLGVKLNNFITTQKEQKNTPKSAT